MITMMSSAAEPREVDAGRVADDLPRLRHELDESHQAVLALHTELADHASELGRVLKLKSRIAEDAGHDLRTPLHAILVLVRLLLDGADGALGAEQTRQVTFIRHSAEELLRLVDDLRGLSEPELGRSILRIESFGLDEFAACVHGVMRPLAARRPAVALLFEEVPRATLETDRTKLGQVMRNLVSHALECTGTGEVRVRMTTHDGVLEAMVCGTGIGITAEDRQRIFDEFAGLALSRRVARRLGGEIDVQSEPGRGATFTLSIPVTHPEAAKMPAAPRLELTPAHADEAGTNA